MTLSHSKRLSRRYSDPEIWYCSHDVRLEFIRWPVIADSLKTLLQAPPAKYRDVARS
jgi:hypothetical protein